MSKPKKSDKETEAKRREKKMVAEGGLGTEAVYNYDEAKDEKEKVTEREIKSSKMVDEGGMGAVNYYNEDEIVAHIDSADDKKEDDETD